MTDGGSRTTEENEEKEGRRQATEPDQVTEGIEREEGRKSSDAVISVSSVVKGRQTG